VILEFVIPYRLVIKVSEESVNSITWLPRTRKAVSIRLQTASQPSKSTIWGSRCLYNYGPSTLSTVTLIVQAYILSQELCCVPQAADTSIGIYTYANHPDGDQVTDWQRHLQFLFQCRFPILCVWIDFFPLRLNGLKNRRVSKLPKTNVCQYFRSE
jgi:hypothetical protein